MNEKLYVHTVSPIDLFDGLHPLSSWVACAEPGAKFYEGETLEGRRRERTLWAIRALFALQDAGTFWEGDFRHEPFVGVLPAPDAFAVSPYLVVKQDNNGTTFIVAEEKLSSLHCFEEPIAVTPRRM